MIEDQLSTTATFDTLLRDNDLTLDKLLSESNVRDEVDHRSNYLIDEEDSDVKEDPLLSFLLEPENLTRIFDIITQPVSKDTLFFTEYHTKFNSACELITMKNKYIEDAIKLDFSVYISKLFNFLATSDVNRFQASFVIGVINSLFTGDMLYFSLNFLNQNPEHFQKLISTYENIAIMPEFLVNLLNKASEEYGSLINKVVNSTNLRPLMEVFGPEHASFHMEASELILELLRCSEILINSPLLESIYGNISLFFELIFQPGNATGLYYGINFLSRLILILMNCQTSSEVNIILIIDYIVKHMPKFNEILAGDHVDNIAVREENSMPSIGLIRIEILDLIRVLLRSRHESFEEQFISLDFFPVILNLFFTFPNNSILHKSIENVVTEVFNNLKESTVLDLLTTKTNFYKRLVQIGKLETILSVNLDPTLKSHRKEYSIFIYVFLDKIVQLCKKNSELNNFLQADREWVEFIEHLEQIKKDHPKSLPNSTLGTLNNICLSFQNGLPSNSEYEGSEENYDDKNLYQDDNDYIDDDDDINFPENTDFPSSKDHKDYDSNDCETLLSKKELNELLEFIFV